MKVPRQFQRRPAPFATPHTLHLRRRRRLAEITTTELARVTKLSPAFLSYAERGHRRLSPRRYEQILAAIEYLERVRGVDVAGLSSPLAPSTLPPAPSSTSPSAPTAQGDASPAEPHPSSR
jgi:transcriptional regulator with XRE-family HTH domain